jgi:cysteinyl-tRNA synthetase
MARRWLGDEFDIHGGGIDLRFPHHENEQAQSRAAGLGFARYWLHNAWVTVKGQKMGKSLGNSLEVRHLLESTRPIVLRYYLTAAHYRSMIEYHPGSLEEASAAVERIEGFLERASRRGQIPRLAPADLPATFVASMDDDLGVSGALAVVHDTVRAGNSALDEDDDEAALEAAGAVVAMTDVLGVNPLAASWGSGGSREDAAAETALEALVRAQLDARQVARQERDFDRADEIRDTLTAVGIEITDTPSGAQWSLARPPRGDAGVAAGGPTDTTTDTTTDDPTAAPGAEKAQG